MVIFFIEFKVSFNEDKINKYHRKYYMVLSLIEKYMLSFLTNMNLCYNCIRTNLTIDGQKRRQDIYSNWYM